jgi:pimeloyl-ACP methyl ester carboxylesterase
MKTVICGFEMHYEITGSEGNPWLILIHGLAGSTRCWKHQTDEFSKHCRVLNLDLVGHGGSGPLNIKRYSGEIVANHIRVLMDYLGIKRAYVLGLSLGTIVQQYLCEMFPDRIIAAIYASPVTKFNVVSSLFNKFSDKIFLKIFPKNAYLKFMGKLMLPGKVHEKSRKFFVQETLRMTNAEFKKWWKLVMEGDHFDFINVSDIPALIIAGEKDFCFFKDSLLLKTKYRNSELHVIKDAGHVTIFQKPEEFNILVIDYICKIEAIKGNYIGQHAKTA